MELETAINKVVWIWLVISNFRSVHQLIVDKIISNLLRFT